MLRLGAKIKKVIFHAQMARFSKKESMEELPTHIQVEPTMRCNLNCITCTRKDVIGRYNKMEIGLEEFHRILAQFPKLKTIKLGGLGEPFMHPQIEDILKLLKDRKIRVWIITNGTLLLNKKIRELILKYVDDISISFDSLKPELFKKIRIGADMERIVEGMKHLIGERIKTGSKTVIGINFVVSHLNYLELDSLYDFAKKMRLDYVIVTDVEDWAIKGEPGYASHVNFVKKTRKLNKEIDQKVSRLQRKLLLSGILFGRKLSRLRLGKCYWPFNSCFVRLDGQITPCNIRMHGEYGMGNIFKEDFKDIWNNPKYVELRKAHIEMIRTNRMCGSCPNA